MSDSLFRTAKPTDGYIPFAPTEDVPSREPGTPVEEVESPSVIDDARASADAARRSATRDATSLTLVLLLVVVMVALIAIAILIVFS
jgi:hypothetical protein